MDMTAGLVLWIMWVNTCQTMTLWPLMATASWFNCPRISDGSNVVQFKRR